MRLGVFLASGCETTHNGAAHPAGRHVAHRMSTVCSVSRLLESFPFTLDFFRASNFRFSACFFNFRRSNFSDFQRCTVRCAATTTKVTGFACAVFFLSHPCSLAQFFVHPLAVALCFLLRSAGAEIFAGLRSRHAAGCAFCFLHFHLRSVTVHSSLLLLSIFNNDCVSICRFTRQTLGVDNFIVNRRARTESHPQSHSH